MVFNVLVIRNFTDDLKISESEGLLESNSIWGILRGIESFSQLLYLSPDGRAVNIFSYFFFLLKF